MENNKIDIYGIVANDGHGMEWFYVHAVVFEEWGLSVMPTSDFAEIAWYTKDKADKYCKELNEQGINNKNAVKYKTIRIGTIDERGVRIENKM